MKNDNSTTNYKLSGRTKDGGVTYVRPTIKIGRNDLCYCESGEKFKNCHMEKQIILKTPD